MLCGCAGRKLEGAKPRWSLIWLSLLKTKTKPKTKTNKKIATKGVKRISIHYLMLGKTVMKYEEKAEDKVFFVSLFSSETKYSLGIHHPELEDRDGGQNEALIIHEKIVTCYTT